MINLTSSVIWCIILVAIHIYPALPQDGIDACGRYPIEFSNLNNASFVIGGIFPVHYFSSGKNKFVYNQAGLMWIEAMKYALEEINNTPEILSNHKLGFKIFDSCNNIDIAIEAALQLTQGFNSYQSNMTCPCVQGKRKAIGIVGDAASITTTRVAATTAASQTTQISYSATSTDLSSKHLYPSFLRTIPPDNFQAILITDLMRTFKWSYINIVACDDNYGRVGVSEMLPYLKNNNICVAVNEIYDIKNDLNKTHTIEVVKKLKQEQEATVIVLWCQPPEAMIVLGEAERMELHHRTWIATESYGTNAKLKDLNPNVIQGMLGVIPAQLSYKPFEDHLKMITPNESHYNPWLQQYWTEVKKCTKMSGKEYKCNDTNVDLSQLPTNKYVNVIDAVYAIAHGLEKYLKDNPKINVADAKPAEVLKYVKNVSFIGKSNVEVSFNQLGNPGDAAYSVNNLQYDGIALNFVEVGLWNYNTRNITFANKLQFANTSENIPRSSCAEACPPGAMGLTFSLRPCCWKCVKCPEGQIQPLRGQLECIRCKGEMLPNKNQTKCIEPNIQQLKVDGTSGTILLVLMVFGYVIVMSAIVIACLHRTTPMVKASNKGLSLLQLISMLCLVTLPLLCFTSKPTVVLCGVRLYYFVGFYAIAVSVTFTKADRLLRIFKASKSGILAKRSNIKGNKVQYLTIAALTFIGLTICTVVYLPFRPTIEKKIKYITDERIHVWYYCGGYYDSMLFLMIGYIGMIALICGVYAFKARKLPETYNEARYTSFAMFTFFLIWMMFVPIYFSTKSEIDRTSTWLYISFAATIVLYVTMYLPKLFIILFKPEENTVTKVREKMKQGNLGSQSDSLHSIGFNGYSKRAAKYSET